MTTSLFYSNYDKLHLLYAGGSHVWTLEYLYDCLLDNMFLFCQNKLILMIIYSYDNTIHINVTLCNYSTATIEPYNHTTSSDLPKDSTTTDIELPDAEEAKQRSCDVYRFSFSVGITGTLCIMGCIGKREIP